MTVSCDPKALHRIKPVLDALGSNFSHYNQPGQGHRAKGIHNAIEYGMMQSIAEGIALYFHYGFTQEQILETFKTWSKGSIIESALVDCVIQCLEQHNFNESLSLKKSETIDLINNLKDCPVPTPVIDQAAKIREQPDLASDISITTIALMRKIFGGHETIDKPKP